MRPVYTPEQAEALRSDARRYGLSAPDSFWTASADHLARVLNGIGPDWLPDYVRAQITENQGRFAVCAAIHDWEYYLSRGIWSEFCAANMRFLTNCRTVVRKTIGPWRWWKREQMYVDADLLYGAVCAGGWPGYAAGAYKAEEVQNGY